MADTRYKKGGYYGADMEYYLRGLAGHNEEQLEAVQEKLAQALREDVTPRQLELLYLHYVKGLRMREIADSLGLDPSTVSRTVKRGEERLRRCLRYSDAAILGQRGRKRPRNHR